MLNVAGVIEQGAPSTTPRPIPWSWIIAVILVGNLAWTTLCLGGYLPSTMVVSAPLTGVLLILHFVRRAIERGRWHPAGWSVIPFLAYAAVNAAWVTPVKWFGWHDWLYWMQMATVFWVAINEFSGSAIRRFVRNALLLIATASALLAFYQRLVNPEWLMLGRTQATQFLGRASGSFGAPNSLGALLLLVFPVTALLAWKSRGPRRPGYLLLAAIQFAALVLTISRGAWLGLVLAATVWPLLGRGGALRPAGFSIGILAVCAAVIGGLYTSMPVVKARLDALIRDSGERSRPILWNAAWKIFREHPAVGSGAGSFNLAFEKFRPERFQEDPQWAHNDYLNTLSDYGATGFILFFGGCGAIALHTWMAARWRRAADKASGSGTSGPDIVSRGLALGLFAFALQLFVDFHFKIPALGMAFATCAALLVTREWKVSLDESREAMEGRAPARPSIFGRIGAMIAAVGAIAGVWFFVLPHFQAEALRYDFRRQVDRLAKAPVDAEFERALVTRARDQFARATEIDPSNAQAWADEAYMLAVYSRHEPSQVKELGSEAEVCARKALGSASISPEYWIRLGVALDMQDRWPDGGEAFDTALKLAPSSSIAWYYQAYHFSLSPGFQAIALSAVATCLRLDPNNQPAEDLRRRLSPSGR